MSRNELFEPGRYLAIPTVLLRSTTLSASAKLVWMALAGHLGPDGTEVWPSMTRLSRQTGLAKNTVLRAVEALKNASLIVVVRQTLGKSNIYRIMQPQAGLFDEKPAENQSGKPTGEASEKPAEPVEPDDYQSEKPTGGTPEEPAKKQSQNGTGPKMAPVPKRDSTGPKMAPEAVPKWDPKYLITTERTTPPLPPKGESGSGFSPKTKTEIIAQCETAHQKAFGKPLPAKWKQDIRREYVDGDAAALERIDATILLEAEKYRITKRWSCLGHGTVMQYLAHIDRIAEAKRQADAKRKTVADKTKAVEAAEAAEAHRRQIEAMEFFQSLPIFEREKHLDRIRGRPFAPLDRPDLMIQIAAIQAFSERDLLAITA